VTLETALSETSSHLRYTSQMAKYIPWACSLMVTVTPGLVRLLMGANILEFIGAVILVGGDVTVG